MKYIIKTTNKKCLLILFGILFTFNSTILAQSSPMNISGTILDAQGESLIGVSIAVVGEKEGTVTDLDGNFTVKAKIGDVLKFTYLGYISIDEKITSSAPLNLVMKENIQEIDEVVVVGYGVVKKSDLTASISTIKSDEMLTTATSSLDQGIQGRASGVYVQTTSGQPGGGTSIRIRGTSSINGTNEPLYVIDGIPVSNETSSTSTGVLKGPASNPLSRINPSDVSSIEVLKDASATSIYGARGANGVILITTKQGKSGKPKVSVGMKYALQHVRKKMKMLNGLQLAQLANEAADNDGVDREPIYADLNNIAKNNTDWQDEIFRTAPLQSYDASVSGGGDGSTYFVSTNIFKQDGIIIGSDYGKGTLRVNFDQKLSKYVKVGFTSNLSYSKSNGVVTNSEGGFASSITSWALEMNPALPVRDKNGNYIYQNNSPSVSNVGNPVQDALETQNRTKAFTTLINAYLEVKPINDLILKSTFGIDYFSVKEQSFADRHLKRAESNFGYANVGNRDGYTWLSENTATYMKSFDKHSFNVLAGMTAQAFSSEFSSVSVSDFEDGTLGFHDLTAAALKQMTTSGKTQWQMLSYLARINYNYDNRYLLTLTGRIDGSSKFGEKHQYGTFPSVAFAWRTSEENFLKDVKTISNLKVRTSYGLVGNEGIPPYSKLGLLFNTEAYQGNSTILKGKVPYVRDNQELKWETTAQFDVGFDLGLLNNRISIVADFYVKKTEDLLLYVPVLLHSGYDGAYKNVGDMRNIGYELALNTIPVRTKNFTWNSDFNFGVNKNKVTYLSNSGGVQGDQILGNTDWTTILQGYSIGTFYGYKTDGIVQLDEDLTSIPYFVAKNPEAGDRKYVNRNSDNVINEEDMVELGNANPDFSYGFTNTFSYSLPNKSTLSLSVFLQGVHGNEIVNFNKFALESFDGNRNNSTAALKRWTPTNPTNKYPRATLKPRENVISDHYVEDGSYLRVKNITLGYDFSKSLANKLFCEGISLFASIQNLYTFTDYSGYDPEVSRFGGDARSMGSDYGSYPTAKSYEFGARINF